MKIQLVTQEKFQWVKGYCEILKYHDVFVTEKIDPKRTTDVFMLMWCNQEAVNFINNYRGKAKIVLFIRRYEMYSSWIRALHASKVNQIIMVNDFFADKFQVRFGIRPKTIYNGIWIDDWTYRERTHGKNIAMVGYILPKKNQGMALQILSELSTDYTLHLAGDVQDVCYLDYLDNYIETTGISVKYYGKVSNMDEWLDDKDYILSCSYSEGCPNNVIEAMAKGIKPVVHYWPGCQFSAFSTINQAVKQITEDGYDSLKYRKLAEKNFGIENYKKVAEIINGFNTSQ